MVSCPANSRRFFRYLEYFNRPETFRKSLQHHKEHGDSNQNENELRNFQRETKLHRNFPLNCVPTFAAFYSWGVLLPEEESSPLQVMWSGAVNRQPGYRARNLQRRGYRAPRETNMYYRTRIHRIPYLNNASRRALLI